MPHFVPAEAGRQQEGALSWSGGPYLYPTSSKPIVLEGETKSGLFATHFLSSNLSV